LTDINPDDVVGRVSVPVRINSLSGAADEVESVTARAAA
jgi:hypothetical protein